jgi:hypothetical protein
MVASAVFEQSIDNHSVTFLTFQSVDEIVARLDLSAFSLFPAIALPYRILCSTDFSLSVNVLLYFLEVSDIIFIILTKMVKHCRV